MSDCRVAHGFLQKEEKYTDVNKHTDPVSEPVLYDTSRTDMHKTHSLKKVLAHDAILRFLTVNSFSWIKKLKPEPTGLQKVASVFSGLNSEV